MTFKFLTLLLICFLFSGIPLLWQSCWAERIYVLLFIGSFCITHEFKNPLNFVNIFSEVNTKLIEVVNRAPFKRADAIVTCMLLYAPATRTDGTTSYLENLMSNNKNSGA